MQSIQSFVQRRYWTLMMLFLIGGFTMLLVELVITDHVDGIQLVAVAASLGGLALAVVGLIASPKLRPVVAVLFLLLSLTGIIGVIEHLDANSGEAERAGQPALAASAGGVATAVSLRLQDGDGNDETQRPPAFQGDRGPQSAPPPLAPLSLAGLSLMGTVILLGRRDKS